MLNIIVRYREKDILPFYVTEEMVLNTCAYCRNNNDDPKGIQRAFELLQYFGIGLDEIYDCDDKAAYTSFINQAARLFAAAQDRERALFVNNDSYTPFVELTTKDVEFSGIKSKYTVDELNNNTSDIDIAIQRWQILYEIAIRLMKHNSEKFLSAPSYNSLAVAYLHTGNSLEAFRCYHMALDRINTYSTTQDYSRRKRTELLAIMLIEHKLELSKNLDELCDILKCNNERQLWLLLKKESASYALVNRREKTLADIAISMYEGTIKPTNECDLTLPGLMELVYIFHNSKECQDSLKDALIKLTNKLETEAHNTLKAVQPSFVGLSIQQLRNILYQAETIAKNIFDDKLNQKIQELHQLLEQETAKRIVQITPLI
jgi:tetratricopeptide (TPR) repeat protein